MNNQSHERCSWVTSEPIYIAYHDVEWGVPLYDETKLFEFLMLEGMQSGLSWITILKKREGYRKAFDNFELNKIVKYKQNKIDQLLENTGIIRNQSKIVAIIHNATLVRELKRQGINFADYLWQFVDGKPLQNHWQHSKDIPTKTIISDTMAKDLKQKGFKFIGSTVCYAFMQAVGMVNDHVSGCFRHQQILQHHL